MPEPARKQALLGAVSSLSIVTMIGMSIYRNLPISLAYSRYTRTSVLVDIRTLPRSQPGRFYAGPVLLRVRFIQLKLSDL